jgi:hypothetical protein
MNIMNIYRKSLTFFSRSRQEEIVSSIEHEFYQAVTIYAQDSHSLCQLHLKLEKICSAIRYHTTHSYFEDDLLEHMFNLLTFVTNYVEDLNATKSPEKHSSMSNIRMCK